MRVDASADEQLQVEAALRVPDQDEAAVRSDAAQERVEGLLDVPVGGQVVPSRGRPGLERREVACRYTGAYTRQTWENRAAW
jgi:hypothetical protein